MVDNRKFRRRHRSATDPARSAAGQARDDASSARDAWKTAEAEAKRFAEEERLRAEAEAQALRLAEEERRKAGALAVQREEERQRAEAEAQRRAEAEKTHLDAKRQRLAVQREQAEARSSRTRAEALRLDADARADTRPDRGHAGVREDPVARQPAPLTLTDPRPLPLTDPVPPEPATPPHSTPTHPPAQAEPDAAWASLAEFSVDARHLNRNRIITAARDDPAHTSFDVLRTRLLQALSDNGWKRVAITSPGKDCGKTFTAANLAISLSRQENCRTLLLDCDMRRPSLHRVMGVEKPGSVGDMLRGKLAPEEHLLRMGRNPVHAGRNIAFGFNDTVEPYASELLQDPRTREALDRIEARLHPDVILFDLPPALFYDDVIAFRPLFDGVLLVIGGGLTTEKEVREVERRLGADTPLLGMVLNKAEGTDHARYTY